jgi:hypothetical protein
MASRLIFKRPLKVIFKLSAEHVKTQVRRPFSDVHGIFTTMRGSPTGEHRERPNSPQMRRLP